MAVSRNTGFRDVTGQITAVKETNSTSLKKFVADLISTWLQHNNLCAIYYAMTEITLKPDFKYSAFLFCKNGSTNICEIVYKDCDTSL